MVWTIAATLALLSLPAEPLPIRVLAPDGKPVAGAKVWACLPSRPDQSRAVPEPRAAMSDAEGHATVAFPRGSRGGMVYARDAAGRIGSSYRQLGRGSVTVQLTAVAPRVVRVTAEDKPVVGAGIRINFSFSAARQSKDRVMSAEMVEALPWTPRAVTDAAGDATVLVPPGYGVFYTVLAAGHEPTQFRTPPGEEMRPVLESSGAIMLRVAGVDAAKAKSAGWQLSRKMSEVAETGTRPICNKYGVLEGSETQRINGLPPGRYELRVTGQGQANAVFVKADAVEIQSGETAPLTLTFGPATTVTGRIVDSSGKGITGMNVPVYVRDKGESQAASHYLNATTEADGRFTVHGPAGWYSVQLGKLPSGYAEKPRGRREGPPTVRAELGKPQVLPTITLINAVTFRAKFVLADGKPAAHAAVTTFETAMFGKDGPVTDAAGRLVMSDLPPDESIAPRGRRGNAVNVPETFVLDKTPNEVTIRLSEANAAGLTGRVLDSDGKPLAGAKVTAMHWLTAVGRQEGMSVNLPVGSVETDPDGRYTVTGLWPTDRYTIAITAKAFAKAEVTSGLAVAGKTADLGTRKLERAGLAVAGVVRDRAGQPVAGAEVFAVDGPERMPTRSAADGSFRLTGFYDAPAWVFAAMPGHRLGVQTVTPGDGRAVAVTLRAADSPPAAPPVVSAEYKAALDKLTRHLLQTMWDRQRDYHVNALADMARYDVATAKKWSDAALAQGKLGYPGTVANAERRQTHPKLALTDIDEVMAQLQALKGDAYPEAKDLALGLLAVDKPAAARVAEEMAVRARKYAPDRKPYALAEVGEIAFLAGNTAGGKKLLAEAADLVEKLDPKTSDRTSAIVGAVACRLAVADWPRAEKLLARLTDTSEKMRWLAATCAHLAASDPEKAIQLLETFPPNEGRYDQHRARIAVAVEVARRDPARAEKIVAGITNESYRFAGYLALAEHADKPRAVRLIDQAFALLGGEPRDFESWSNYGGAAGFAAIGSVYAARVSHPETAEFVTRALSLRSPEANSHSAQAKERLTAGFATVLALADPATARRVVAGVAPGSLEAGAITDRNVLFALALADPAGATLVVDKLFARPARLRPDDNELTGTGLVELGTILTTPDPLQGLNVYGNLPPIARDWRD